MTTKSRSVRITAIEGNRQRLDGGAMFGNAPRELWQNWLRPDEHGRVELTCRAMLIESPAGTILCETGIGAFFEPKLASRFGVFEPEHMLLKNLAAHAISQDEIDYVVLSHLHFDHAGGLLPTYAAMQAGDDKLLFPNAKYIVGEEALTRCQNPHERDRASFIPGLATKLLASGRLIVVKKNEVPAKLEGLLSFRYSHGHTPGQMHTVVHGNEHNVVFAGDLIPGRAWVHLPITMGYDRFPELLIDEKKALYAEAEPAGWYVFFTHDPEIALAKIVVGNKGRYEAAQEQARPVRLSV